ncbi:MAG: cytochrome b/b6 domain-containing protein [Gammaproteobacteria bacterium]
MQHRPVLVWDLPVRLFHWLIVALVAGAWYTGETGGLTLKYHMWCGYAVLSLVLFRVAWGFVGSRSARFADFLCGPRAVAAAVRELLHARPLPQAGHNPVGGWMVLALIVTLLVQTATGLFANDDLFNEGPLYTHVSKATSDTLTGIHEANFVLLMVLVAVHVLAVVYHRLRKGERLTRAMVTGRKLLPGEVDAPALAPAWRALVLIAASAAMVSAIVKL